MPFLTKQEVSKLLHVSPRTIDTMRFERNLPYLTMPQTRRILFDKDAVLAWLQSVNNDNEIEKEDDNVKK